ncbi:MULTISPECIES: hypothetical protein [unclassified Streptomyces]|uniref:hypothetical protein n=1 Tax=unclassified Streptomyces TaxID=2593676 RepID=UPI0013683034|nr:hypothetical protein [Streptomyces sp. DvalAA-14]MYS24395.1 hypothetical protein [Streptomyces sp. SID4948]
MARGDRADAGRGALGEGAQAAGAGEGAERAGHAVGLEVGDEDAGLVGARPRPYAQVQIGARRDESAAAALPPPGRRGPGCPVSASGSAARTASVVARAAVP